MPNHRPEEYKHIKAWGQYLYSLPHYIKDQQERASSDEAPVNAIFHSPDMGRWITADEIENLEIKTIIEEDVRKQATIESIK